MKVVILAGGLGTRISEETDIKPKPMVEIGGKPLLWHIMKIYSYHGLKDFIICLGYKGYVIKEFFLNYYSHMSDISINLETGKHSIINSQAEDWKITLVDTGNETMTGGRLKRVSDYLNNKTFCMTYGDGLADINVTNEIEFHRKHGKLATVAAVQPPGRFGLLKIDSKSNVVSFDEKPKDEIGWINGGFFVLEPEVINLIEDDSISWETIPLQKLTKLEQLSAYQHKSFWRACDTLRDKRELETLWDQDLAFWLK